MLDKNRKLIITYHAKERSRQFRIPIIKLAEMFWESDKEPKPPGYKSDGTEKVTIYRRHGTLVMVAGEVVDIEELLKRGAEAPKPEVWGEGSRPSQPPGRPGGIDIDPITGEAKGTDSPSPEM